VQVNIGAVIYLPDWAEEGKPIIFEKKNYAVEIKKKGGEGFSLPSGRDAKAPLPCLIKKKKKGPSSYGGKEGGSVL